MAKKNRGTRNGANKRALRRGAKMLALAALALGALGNGNAAFADEVYAGRVVVDDGDDAHDIRFDLPEKIHLMPPGDTGVHFRVNYRLNEKSAFWTFTAARVRIEREVGDFGSGRWEAIWSDVKSYPRDADNERGNL